MGNTGSSAYNRLYGPFICILHLYQFRQAWLDARREWALQISLRQAKSQDTVMGLIDVTQLGVGDVVQCRANKRWHRVIVTQRTSSQIVVISLKTQDLCQNQWKYPRDKDEIHQFCIPVKDTDRFKACAATTWKTKKKPLGQHY